MEALWVAVGLGIHFWSWIGFGHRGLDKGRYINLTHGRGRQEEFFALMKADWCLV